MNRFFRNLSFPVIGALALLVSACSGETSGTASADASSKEPATQATVVDGIWSQDYAGALARAKAEGKPVLLDFTGSDWCPPCKAMHSQVLTQPAFVDYAKDHLVTVVLDYPQDKPQSAELQAQNQKLQGDYAIQGYPTFIVLGPDGKELGRHIGFLGGGPDAFLKFVKGAIAKQ